MKWDISCSAVPRCPEWSELWQVQCMWPCNPPRKQTFLLQALRVTAEVVFRTLQKTRCVQNISQLPGTATVFD